MLLLKILLGLIGLSFVVFIHELGHFIGARLCGIKVERLSLFMGKVLWSFRWRGTEFAISSIPIGGYCKMKGEKMMLQSMDNLSAPLKSEEGDHYAASPLKRIIVAFAGPFANFFLAVFLYFCFFFFGYQTSEPSNKIVVVSDYPVVFGSSASPAAEAGLKSGDSIIEIDKERVTTFNDLRTKVSFKAGREVDVRVKRKEELLDFTVIPLKNPDNGLGMLGVSDWQSLKVWLIDKKSFAYTEGIRRGDVIKESDSTPLFNYYDLLSKLTANLKDEKIKTTKLLIAPSTGEEKEMILKEEDYSRFFGGISFDEIINHPPIPFTGAVTDSFQMFFGEMKSYYEGIAALIMGRLNAMKSVAGPITITNVIGSVATAPLLPPGERIYMTLRLLAMISIALGVMNLLPIPVVDGGLILFYCVEAIRRRPWSLKQILRYQTVGSAFVGALIITVLVIEVINLFVS